MEGQMEHSANDGGDEIEDADDCTKTCGWDDMEKHLPTCEAVKSYIAPGGCASHCTQENKDMAVEAFCSNLPSAPSLTLVQMLHLEKRPDGNDNDKKDRTKASQMDFGSGPPPCAKTCPNDKVPTCDDIFMYIDETGKGCAHTCSQKLKGIAIAHFCGGGDQLTGSWAPAPAPVADGGEERPFEPPPCAKTCPFASPTCDDILKYIDEDIKGCAHKCPEDIKGMAIGLFCDGLGAPAPSLDATADSLDGKKGAERDGKKEDGKRDGEK